MKNEPSKNELNYIDEYQKQGYTCNFLFQDNLIVETETKNSYKPTDIFIVTQH